MGEFVSGYGPRPADLELLEVMDADRTAALLDPRGRTNDCHAVGGRSCCSAIAEEHNP